jgi:VWFA-related protein
MPSAHLVVAMLMAAPAGPPVVPDVRAELVQIDVVVTDAEGQPVRGLGRADFEVREDGKPQRVAQFLGAPSEPPPGPRRRVVLLVDDLHIARSGLDDVKQALRRLVAEIVSPEDEVGLVTTASGPVQPLTRDRAVLGQAIQKLSLHDVALPPSHGAWMSAAQAELVLRGDRNARRLAARVLVDEPGSSFDATTPRAALDAARGGSPAASIGSEAERAAEKEVERQARAVLAEALRFSSVSLGAIEGTLRGLGGAPGRKICLLVSDGFLVGAGTSEERTRELQRVIDAATRSGTVVYALATRGLVP